MLNKLKNTTALVGALSIAATASFAETKVTGDIEQTFITHSQDLAANKIDGTNGFGTETNISLSNSKALSNGLTAKFGFTLEADGAANSDAKYLTVGGKNFSVTIGEDVGNNLQSTVLPFVSDNFETIGGSSGAGLSFDSHGSTIVGAMGANLNVHEYAHISADYAFDGGVATVRYAPHASSKIGDSVSSTGPSAVEYLVAGKANNVGYRVGKMVAAKTSSAEGSDVTYTVYGLSYEMNGITVAAEKRLTDNGTTATTAETTATQYGVAYATDQFSAGVYMLKNDRDATAITEDAKMIQIGYNMGGLGVDISYMQITDAAFTAGRDADVLQIRTIQKF